MNYTKMSIDTIFKSEEKYLEKWLIISFEHTFFIYALYEIIIKTVTNA